MMDFLDNIRPAIEFRKPKTAKAPSLLLELLGSVGSTYVADHRSLGFFLFQCAGGHIDIVNKFEGRLSCRVYMWLN